jgi:hypothetical protein
MSRIPLKYHTNVLFYTKIHTLHLSVGGRTDGRTHGRTDGRTENIYSIFRDKLLLRGEHVFQRESWLWCVGRKISSLAGLDSVFGNALQNATQLFFNRIPQMTKYCVMRECENIHSWISLSGDLVFSHQ